MKCNRVYGHAREGEDEDTDVMGPPKKSRGATRKVASKSIADIELESKRLDSCVRVVITFFHATI